MKFSPGPRTTGPRLLRFRLSKLEKALLLATVQLFPVLPAGYHRLTKDPQDAPPAEQHLLEEAMARQKAEHKARINKFLRSEAPFFQEVEDDVYLHLTAEQLEWLLQVLNDIRVGSWVKLGSPDVDAVRREALAGDEARAVAAMDMSAYFQSGLLEAFK
ncbi:MAG TPA: hypothetical protein VH595_01185 [Verrucomicrobiae bacterium]|jgi:hypothetical protein|nr:hypothetical protein [Verrucomicrobiae bacterium]